MMVVKSGDLHSGDIRWIRTELVAARRGGGGLSTTALPLAPYKVQFHSGAYESGRGRGSSVGDQGANQ